MSDWGWGFNWKIRILGARQVFPSLCLHPRLFTQLLRIFPSHDLSACNLLHLRNVIIWLLSVIHVENWFDSSRKATVFVVKEIDWWQGWKSLSVFLSLSWGGSPNSHELFPVRKSKQSRKHKEKGQKLLCIHATSPPKNIFSKDVFDFNFLKSWTLAQEIGNLAKPRF